MDLVMLCALGMGLAFAVMQVALKQILRRPVFGGIERRAVAGGWMLGERRKPDVVPWMFPALVGLLFPVWLALAWSGWQTGMLVWDLSWEAVRWPLMWAAVMVVSGTCFAWLIQRFSLSEVLGYKKGLITLGAAVVDVLVFGHALPWVTLLAIVLLLGGAGALTQGRVGKPEPRQVAVLVAWCALVVGQLSLYKAGLNVQQDMFAYVVLAQGLASGMFALLWLRKDVRRVPLPWGWVTLLLVCVFVGNVLEAYAYGHAGMAVVLVLSMLPATLFGAYDLLRGDLRVQPLTLVGMAAIVAGFYVLVSW